MAARTLRTVPAISGLYAKAVATALPAPLRPHRAPDAAADLMPAAVRVEGLVVDPDRLSSYREVCGFAGQSVPATYPQVLAFPLQLAVMTDPLFPFATLGVVHIANTITQLKPLSLQEPFDLTVSCGPPTPHPRGRQVSLVAEAEYAGEVVWRAVSVMLRREHSEPRPETLSLHSPASFGAEPPDRADLDSKAAAPTGPQVWRLSGNLGRRYAAVSGDRNPIHLFDLTAKPFGFSHHIAHGMWTKARCLAELQNRLPDSYTVDVSFRKPVRLPGSVRFGARGDATSLDFGVSSLSSSSTHLVGRTTAADG